MNLVTKTIANTGANGNLVKKAKIGYRKSVPTKNYVKKKAVGSGSSEIFDAEQKTKESFRSDEVVVRNNHSKKKGKAKIFFVEPEYKRRLKKIP
ncbi:hypothetical protein P7D46_06600 [Enterococcus dongliensis]|nr:hypothetical protein [Enterococcus dongliensis]MDT2613369.1 hypothetical protein [Enterococcus dongliensis]